MEENKNSNGNKMFIGIIIGAIIVMFFGILINNQPAKEIKSNVDNTSSNTYNGTSNYTTQTSEYCSKAGCTNKRASGSVYCYTHKSSSSSSSSSSSNSSSGTSSKRCAATPCPNDAVAGSSYCSIHKKGKTKKCAKCSKAIWDDETFCDDCLYGSVINSMNK